MNIKTILKRVYRKAVALKKSRNQISVENVYLENGIYFIQVKKNKFNGKIFKKNSSLIFSDKVKEVELPLILKHIKDNSYVLPVKLKDLPEIKKDETNWHIKLLYQKSKPKKFSFVVGKKLKRYLHTQKFFEDGQTYSLKATRHNKLMINHFDQKNTEDIKHLINNVHNLREEEGYLLISGDFIGEQFLFTQPFDGIKLVSHSRGSRMKQEYRVEMIGDAQWTVRIPYEDFPSSKTILDFYFLLFKNNQEFRFRVKLIDDFGVSDRKFIVDHDKKGAIEYTPYQTELYSLSIKSDVKTIKLNSLEVDESPDSYIITGRIKKKYNLVRPEVVFKNRDSENFISFTAELRTDQNFHYFSAEVSKEVLFNDELVIYDIYMSDFVEGNRIKFRLKRKSTNLKWDTIKEFFDGNNFYQSFFYSTEFGNLSYGIVKPSISKKVDHAIIKDNNVKIKGEAYIERENVEDISQQQLMVVFMNRESEREIICTQEGNKIDVSYPLEKISDLIAQPKDIVDIYIRVQINGFMNQRKLGLDEYDYLKDDYLAKGFIEGATNSIQMFMTLTPYGNVKLETQSYPNEYFQLLEQSSLDGTSGDIWLIGERPDTAQDTGYHFFKHLREHHPEIEAYYVIEQDSEDEKNVARFGNVLHLGTDEHINKSLQASAFFCSHDIEYILPFKGKDMVNYRNGLRVFLQHGVLGRKNVEYHKIYYKYPFNMVCVSSEPEKDLVVEKLKYEEEEVVVTGLSRFDNLFETTEENRILLIPTWRQWLNTTETFKESEYWSRYLSLLANERLLSLLEKHDLILDFYPHYRMQQFIEESNIVLDSKINLIRLGEVNVQDLLKRSELMITDFSSVSFDFNFMHKPVMFYHFDFRRFFARGILRPKNETFLGDIATSEEELVDRIQESIEKGFQEKEEVETKRDQILAHTDNENSERIFRAANKYL
ncbi:hypothetical protein CEY16_07630 [Halalkalibacillus sediminis]|uniref:Teichoic acid biosynthesis protein n=1 Tax=Halalkalibacillus sediminis TaxID=2018042 RepID=A0A2I0QTX5_9BACI|nr:CDP-glycerol glycerophosphotransferase family protein [Halalkalibacillus sediminis]PKR77793.1 hypothetical protein CEY16_07630 [Halalkalibacillus sediminis]